ncbi:hypothetical protein Focb16_v012194 [Fusarium oxysporum f. sp. cubense]|uniref:Uncharacterized protein n=2 Tax=Fusarium oxysporum f. sp. cubense TaxID=61366 RepID=N4UUF2_FUSC1|nr:hypothetical protein FOC1_g10011057 [Fusarium oxysporum f. sp. cubense race 1]TVY72357.1 hypothetical protein Focb16_v012194 [Fusarium oxysporum f. sp. cubense]
MLWRRSRLTYDPKQFPNYRPYPETGSERLIKECPNVFHFIAFTIRFQISIFSIILEWFCMMLRSPLQYSKHTDWILDHYKASPTASHMLWGAFITAWSSHFMYRIGKAVCEVIIDAYDDPVWALYEIWDLGVYSQFFLIRTIFFILTTIFNFVCFWAIFLFNMSTYSFVVSLALLGAVAMWQLHYYFFVYSPQEVTEEVSYQSPEKEVLSTPDRPGRCFRAPTPSTGSSTSSPRSSPEHTPPHLRPRPSNKPPGAAYVKVSPKAIQKLHDEGVFVPEPTRVPDYSYLEPFAGKRPTNFSRYDAKRHFRRVRELERKKGIISNSPDPYKDDPPSPTVITKTAWIYSEMDAVNRRLRFITEDVTEMNMLVNTFREKGSVRSLPDASPAIPLSPRTQRRNATLAEKDRIGEVVIDYTREIDSISFRVFSHKTRTEEALKRIDRLVAHAGDAASRAIRKEVEACRSRVDLAFEGAEAAVMSSSGIADLCIDRKVKLEAQAKKLRRMDRTQARHPNISIIDDYYG